MLKRLAVLCLFLFLPLAACSNTQPLGPGVTQAKADLHVAEGYFAKAQAAIIGLAKAGVLKGDALVKAKQAEAVAYEAVKVARAAVDANNAGAVAIVSAALVKVLELVAIYIPGSK